MKVVLALFALVVVAAAMPDPGLLDVQTSVNKGQQIMGAKGGEKDPKDLKPISKRGIEYVSSVYNPYHYGYLKGYPYHYYPYNSYFRTYPYYYV